VHRVGIESLEVHEMTIAVAHIDSAEGEAALLHAAKEAVFLKTSLAVLHILDGDEPAAAEREVATLRSRLQQMLAGAGFGELDWALHTAKDETGKAAALVDLTEEVGADLLVVGSRRRTPIGKFLLGSTVQRLVLDAPVPVLVVKPPRPETQR
jgi:nucleotide-binding universal stress UspA family protein